MFIHYIFINWPHTYGDLHTSLNVPIFYSISYGSKIKKYTIKDHRKKDEEESVILKRVKYVLYVSRDLE